MVSVSSVAAPDRGKRHSGSSVSETLHSETFHLTPACNIPVAAGPRDDTPMGGRTVAVQVAALASLRIASLFPSGALCLGMFGRRL